MSCLCIVISISCHVSELSCLIIVISMSCRVYALSYLWVFVSMHCHIYELLCLWVVVSMNCHAYELSMSCHVYELSCLSIVMSINCHIDEINQCLFLDIICEIQIHSFWFICLMHIKFLRFAVVFLLTKEWEKNHLLAYLYIEIGHWSVCKLIRRNTDFKISMLATNFLFVLIYFCFKSIMNKII